jgi:hypothetical protein
VEMQGRETRQRLHKERIVEELHHVGLDVSAKTFTIIIDQQ